MNAVAGANAAAQTALAQRRIAQLAATLPVHRAFQWLHLQGQQLLRWQMEMLSIPAPPFGERPRAEWFLDRFRELGLNNVHRDKEGNALGELGAQEGDAGKPLLLLSAHLDTVFPAGVPTDPTIEDARIVGPGACDNAAGLTALLAVIAALRFARIDPPGPILFAANVGEEGEGNLRGMRHLFQRGPYCGRIACALALEGAGTAVAVTKALGSQRFRVTISGPGGHSWTDAGMPNPIMLLARGLATLDQIDLTAGAERTASRPRTTLSAGQITGGTSVNTIPSEASVSLDLRSTDAHRLDTLSAEVCQVFRAILDEHGQSSVVGAGATLAIEDIGNRPSGALPDDSPLLHSLRAVDRHLGLRSELRMGSTDANLPISMGIPAIAIGAGGSGGGVHTLAEWYDPSGRETALRRILLLLLDRSSALAGGQEQVRVG